MNRSLHAPPLVACDERRAEGAPGVSCRGLNPDLVERPFAEQPPVGDAVERHAARQTQSPLARLGVDVPRHPKDDLLRHHLDAPGQIHLALRQLALELAVRASEQIRKPAVRHPHAGRIAEVALVESEGAVGLQVDEVIEDRVHVARLAVGREAHQLVFAPSWRGSRRTW